ncbi:MAG: hypothetical protein ABJC26_14150 [Gemmatimonadaceae bacterium]
MKRVALFVALVALGACAKKDEAKMDSATAMAPAMAPTMAPPMTDSARKADSIKMADSMAMKMKDTTKH